MKSVEAEWALKNKDNINIIDVRTPQEFKGGHIDGAKNIPYPGIILNANQFLNKDEEFYFICRSGNRSAMTVTQLLNMGYKAINVSGGNQKIGLA